jgi:flagellin
VTTTGTGTGTLTGAIRTALGDNNWTATVASTGAITLTDGTNETIGTPVINADAVTIADGTGDTGTYTGSTSTDGVAGVAPTLNTRAVVTSSLNGVFATGDTFGGSLTVAGTTVNLTGTDNTLAALNSALNAANTGAGVGYTATQDSAGDLIFTQTQAAATAGVQTTLPVINLSGLGNYSGTVQTGGYTTVNVGEGPGASFTDNGNTVNSTYTQNAGNQSTFYFSNGLAFSIANMPATGSVSVNGTIAATPGTTTTGSNLEFQIGANEGQTVAIGLGSTAADQLGTSSTPLTYQDASGNTQTVLTNNVSDINVTTFKGAQDAIAVIDQAISQVSTYEANLGAFDDNVLQSQEQSLGAATTNLQAAQATISDADMASTVVDYTKNQILVQSATSALAFANQMPQSILKLLQ